MTIQKAARRGWWLYQFLFFTTILMFVSCGDKGTGPDPEEEIIEVKVIAKDHDTKETLSSLTFQVQDESGEENTDTLILEREKGSLVGVSVSKDGYNSNGKTIEFTNNKTVVVFLTKDTPDKIDTSYQIEDTQGFLIEDAEAFIAGTDTTVGGAEGSFKMEPGSGTVDLCGRADGHEDGCTSISREQDNPDVNIVLEEAEEVSVSVSVSDEETGEAVDEPTITVDDYTYESGEMSHSFPARDGDRSVFVTAAGYDTTETTISADESHDLDISLVDLPECSDGINNDGVDGTDKEDPGCTDEDGNYDPQDDNETLRVARIIYAGETTIKEAVSGQEGERKIVIIPRHVSPIPSSIQKAVSISIKVNALTEEDQTGEAWALRLKTGPTDDDLETVYTSDIIEDQGRDGWHTVVFEIPNDAFARGREYEIILIHATKMRGDPTTDGNDEVVFALPGDESKHRLVIQWEYQPEDVDDSEKAKMETDDYETVELSPTLE